MKTKLEEVQAELFFGGYNADKNTNAQIKAALEIGDGAFTVRHETTRGLDKEVAQLAFKWSENKERPTWRETELTITKPGGTKLEGLFKFAPSHKYKAKEMYNMLHGRSVRVEKAFFTKNSKTPIKYKEWDTLNLNQKTDANEFPVVSEKFNGFERELDKLNAMFASPDDRENFQKDLEKGNVVKRKVVEDGKMVDRYFQANPIAGEIIKSAKPEIGQNVSVGNTEGNAEAVDDKKKVANGKGTAAADASGQRAAAKVSESPNKNQDAQQRKSGQRSSAKNGSSRSEAGEKKKVRARKMA